MYSFNSSFDNKIIELLTGPLFFFLIYTIVVLLAFIIFLLVCRILMFKKCGQKWWKAIIPFYGTYIFVTKIAGLHWVFFVLAETWFFGLYSSILMTIVYAMAFYNLAKKCQYDVIVTTIIGALFSGIMTAIYAFNSNIVYISSIEVNNCSFFSNIIK